MINLEVICTSINIFKILWSVLHLLLFILTAVLAIFIGGGDLWSL